MNNLILAAILLILIAILVATIVFLVRVTERIKDAFAFVESFRGFFVAPDDKTPSQFAQTVDVAGKVIGRAIAIEVKTTLMGKASVDAKMLQAAEADIKQDTLATQLPLIGNLVSGSPSLQKRLRKSPGLMDLLLQYGPQFLGGKFGGSGGNGSSVGTHPGGDGPKFSL